MSVDVKKIIQELIVPELREIKLEIRGVTVEIKRLDEKIDSGFARLDEKIDSGLARLDEKVDSGLARLSEKIDSLRNEMRSELRRIDDKIDSGLSKLDDKIDMAMQFRDRIAALEAKVAILTHS